MNTPINNKVQLTGHLGAAPEIREFEAGKKLARLRLATSDSYTNAKGENVTETFWHNVVAWGKLADQASKNFTKGSMITVEGKLVNKAYTDKQGEKKYITEVVAHEMAEINKATQG